MLASSAAPETRHVTPAPRRRGSEGQLTESGLTLANSSSCLSSALLSVLPGTGPAGGCLVAGGDREPLGVDVVLGSVIGELTVSGGVNDWHPGSLGW